MFFKATKTTKTTTVEDVLIETDSEQLEPRMGFFAALWSGGGYKDARISNKVDSRDALDDFEYNRPG